MNTLSPFVYLLAALVIVITISVVVAIYAGYEIWKQRTAARNDLHPSIANRRRTM